MELKNMIDKRKSVRKFSDTPVSANTLGQIREAFAAFKPLYPMIKVAWEVVEQAQVRFYLPWRTPQLIAIYSENQPGYLENAGFLFQQMDLYLQSIGLGACWMGMGKVRENLDCNLEDMEFVILLAFGYPEGDALREDSSQFQRKSLAEIADAEDLRLEPARLAPSSTNSQPWFFVHEEDAIHAYCSKAGVLRHLGLGKMNRIDMGIALAHMYVANPDSFHFFMAPPAQERKGYLYIGTFVV